VLVVEDRKDIVDLFIAVLSFGGHDAVPAYNGKEGLEALAKHSDISMIFSDYDMPVMKGFEFTKNVRTNPEYKAYSNIPIVGVGDFPDAEKGYLTKSRKKPVGPQDLLGDVAEFCK
jgi:CheY-like chemotaxis protein